MSSLKESWTDVPREPQPGCSSFERTLIVKIDFLLPSI